MDLCGSILTNKYAEGLPGKRYYNGCVNVDEIENIAIEYATKLFNCEFANVQPHSGANANLAVFKAFLNPTDTVVSMDLASGGHLSHGAKVNVSGSWFISHNYGVNEQGLIDYDAVAQLVWDTRPKLVIAGASAGASATGGLGSIFSGLQGVETAPVSFGTGGYASGIGGQVMNNAAPLVEGQSLEQALGYTIPKQNLANAVSPEAIAKSGFPTFEQSGFNNLNAGANVKAPFSTEAFTNNPLMSQQIANNAGQVASTSFLDKLGLNNLSTMDKIGLGKMGLDVGFPNQPQQMIQPQVIPITKGNPDMVSSPLYNVAPNVSKQAGNEIGLPNLLSRMPLTEEEKAQLARLNQRY